MKPLLTTMCAALLIETALSPAGADATSWSGTWKLNEAKSKMTGDTFTYATAADGKITFSGGSLTYTFACDGKPYPTIADRTLLCVKKSDSSYAFTFVAGSKTLSTLVETLSADGTHLADKETGTRPDGSAIADETDYVRMSGTSGIAGAWKNVKVSNNVPATVIISQSGSKRHVDLPAYKQIYDSALDGSASAISGPNMPPGVTMAVTADSPAKTHYVLKYKDKVMYLGTQSLSSDGMTMTEIEWVPGKMNEAETFVYDKQ